MKDKSFSRDTDDEQIILRGGRKILVSKYLITTLDKLSFIEFYLCGGTEVNKNGDPC